MENKLTSLELRLVRRVCSLEREVKELGEVLAGSRAATNKMNEAVARDDLARERDKLKTTAVVAMVDRDTARRERDTARLERDAAIDVSASLCAALEAQVARLTEERAELNLKGNQCPHCGS